MIEILDKYPKAAEEIRNYYKKIFLDNFKGHLEEVDLQDHFTKMVLSNGELANLLEANPIYIIYMFDEQEILIDIDTHVYINGIFFSYQIVGVDSEDTEFASRKEAEKAAIISAIKLLENKL